MRCLFSSILLLITVNISAQKQDTATTAAFGKFQKELKNYRLQVKSDSILYAMKIGIVAECDQYVLLWKETENNGAHIAVHPRKESFCSGWKRLKRQCRKIAKKSEKSGVEYGMLGYHAEYVGNRYIIVTGDAAVNSIRREVYYYVRKEIK